MGYNLRYKGKIAKYIPSLLGPEATLISSGQQPNSVTLQHPK